MGYIGAGISRFNTADSLTVTGDVTASGTVLPTGDTAAGDAAAVGFTSAEGLILTGQGSSSDLTIKNDADATVFSVPTGQQKILFPDNARAMFGDGSDLQIYHDGSDSYINDTGTGNLRLAGSSQVDIISSGGEFMAKFIADGAATLYHNNAAKISTTATGIDVQGQVIATKGSTGTLATFTDGVATNFTLKTDGSSVGTFGTEAGSTQLAFMVANSEKMRLDGSGNVGIGLSSGIDGKLHVAGNTVVGDSSTTAFSSFTSGGLDVAVGSGTKAFQVWDDNSTSTPRFIVERGGNVGINTAAPASLLHLDQGSGGAGLRFERDSYDTMDIELSESGFRIRNETDGRTDLFIDGSGNVGIGVSSMTNKLVLPNAAYFAMQDTGGAESLAIRANSSNAMELLTGGGIKMTLDSNGNLLVGQSSQTVPGFSNNTVGHSIRANGDIFSSCSAGTAMYANRSTNDGVVVSFRRQGNGVGSVSVTSSGATYNTTSDIRLKQDIEPLEATDKLMQMNPVSYSWKADPDGPRSMGFIAQEMADVMPEAVSTGDDDMMSMDYGRITPILVSALQDAHRKIEQLEQRIAEMETGNE